MPVAPTGPLMAPGLGVDVATGVPGALEVGDVMTERGVCGELVGVVTDTVAQPDPVQHVMCSAPPLLAPHAVAVVQQR